MDIDMESKDGMNLEDFNLDSIGKIIEGFNI